MKSLGRTGLQVSAIGFGSYELRLVDSKSAAQLLTDALDNGVNYIDTAPCYGPAERYIGDCIADRRGEYILASKCGCVLGTGISGHPTRFDRKNMLENLENSLRLMKTDHLDVWMLHGATPEDLPKGIADEAIETLQEAKKTGKVLHIGASFKNGGPSDALYPAGFGLEAMRAFSPWNVFEVIQIVYGAMTRKNEDAIQKAYDKGVGIVVRGIIKEYSGQYAEWYSKAGIDELLSEGETRIDFLIKFCIYSESISTALIGTKDVGHWRKDLQIANESVPLSERVFMEAKRRLDRIGVVSDIM